MRLTLRTLLAWLDDKLPPSEVREIGKQVAESTYAKDLVERIHKVARQRRLSVPSSNGPDATDPNIVASYIDNELAPEHVGDFEKKCLTSDVHLAEVSSVHQVLSLIGQKARVPTEARLRMYQLVKGREATRPKGAPIARAVASEPVAQPIQPWVVPPPPSRPVYQEYGPAALVLGLMLILGWSAWKTLSVPEPSKSYRSPTGTSAPLAVAPSPIPANPAQPEAATPAPTSPAAPNTPQPATATPAEGAATKAEPKPPAPAREFPPGAVGLAKKPAGILLRFNPEAREWVRVADALGLKEQDRLLSLDPFRSTLELGSADVDLVRETEVWTKSTPTTQAARFALTQGRVVLHGNPSGLPFEVQANDLTVTIATPPNVLVGVERVGPRASGEATASAPILRVHAAEGPVVVTVGSTSGTLDAAGTITVGPGGTLSEPAAKPAPTWVTETTPAPFDQKVGEQFLQFFRPDRSIVSSLVEASEDEQKDVCRLAIMALRAVGDVGFVVPILKRAGSPSAPVSRRSAIAVLRASLGEGPDAAKALREQLQNELGNEVAATAEKLLVGYTPKEAEDERTFAVLVGLLAATDPTPVGVRELALDNLRQLTGRDDLDYDPEHPEGKGLKAWQDLLEHHELKAVKPASEKK